MQTRRWALVIRPHKLDILTEPDNGTPAPSPTFSEGTTGAYWSPSKKEVLSASEDADYEVTMIMD